MTIKSTKSKFFCPLSNYILWWHNLEFKECPLVPSHRDMPECKNCKLKIDEKWDGPKEKWKDKPVKKRKKKKPKRSRNGPKHYSSRKK